MEKYQFKLKPEEIILLKNTLNKNINILSTINFENIDPKSGRTILNCDIQTAREIQCELGSYLMEVGFDENDNPTKEGLLIEDLIDKFYIKS